MRSTLLCAFLALAATALIASPPKPSIKGLSATASHGKVTVKFSLEGAFRDGEMVEALRSGVPTTFTYYIEFFRDRPNWFDEDAGHARIEVICTYNSLTREYLLNYRRDRHLVRSETFTDLATLQHHMTTLDEVDLFDLGTRRPYKMKVRAKADLMRGWLMYVIPWEVSTRWAETRVKAIEP